MTANVLRTKDGDFLKLSDGHFLKLSGKTKSDGREVIDPDNAIWPVIPAQNGYFLCSLKFGPTIPETDEGIFEQMRFEPVIAWRMEPGGAQPVTLGKPSKDAFAIQCPDGRFAVLWGPFSWWQKEELLTEVRLWWEGSLEHTAARRAARATALVD